MAVTFPLPADLPTDWAINQTVSPSGTDVGLSQQHGYNYLNAAVNAAQEGSNQNNQDLSDHEVSLIHVFQATAALTPAGALELTGSLPAEKDGLTVQFVSPAAAADGLQAKFAGSDALYPILTTGEGKEPISAGAGDQGVPVTLTVSGGSCFFKAGAGVNDTLPPQTKISASPGYEQATIALQPALENPAFAGTMLVRKVGSMPETVRDGVKIDAATATTYTDIGLTNDIQYYYRAFAYNPKRQYQTELTGALAVAVPGKGRDLYARNAMYNNTSLDVVPSDFQGISSVVTPSQLGEPVDQFAVSSKPESLFLCDSYLHRFSLSSNKEMWRIVDIVSKGSIFTILSTDFNKDSGTIWCLLGNDPNDIVTVDFTLSQGRVKAKAVASEIYTGHPSVDANGSLYTIGNNTTVQQRISPSSPGTVSKSLVLPQTLGGGVTTLFNDALWVFGIRGIYKVGLDLTLLNSWNVDNITWSGVVNDGESMYACETKLAGVRTDKIVCYNTEGQKMWETLLPITRYGSITLNTDGLLYVAQYEGNTSYLSSYTKKGVMVSTEVVANKKYSSILGARPDNTRSN